MMAMVDSATGMVYWVPADSTTPVPPLAPIVMPYRFLQPVYPLDATPVRPVVNTTVFVRGIPREATTQTVEGHFNPYGDIQSCHVIRHKDASTNKGIAFVKFYEFAAAQRAVHCNNPGVMDQREIFAEFAHPKPSNHGQATENPSPSWQARREYSHPQIYLPSPTSHLLTPSLFFPPHNHHHVLSPNPHGAIAGAYATSLNHPPMGVTPWILTPASSSPVPAFASSTLLPGSHVLGYPYPGFSTPVGCRRNLHYHGGSGCMAMVDNRTSTRETIPTTLASRSFHHHEYEAELGSTSVRAQSSSQTATGRDMDRNMDLSPDRLRVDTDSSSIKSP